MLVYLILNKINGKAYVGQTVRDLKGRWRQHLFSARVGSLYPIHQAIRKYGAENFEYCPLAEAENLNDLNALEEEEIAKWGTLAPGGYNLQRGGNNRAQHPETRAKLSAAHTGKKLSAEHRARISAAGIGRKHSAKTRARMSAASMGNKRALGCHRSEEFRAKLKGNKNSLGNKNRLGYRASDETRARMSAARTGKKLSPGHCAKLSAALMGRHHSEESIAKMRGNKNRLGQHPSDETRAKLMGNKNALGCHRSDETKRKISAASRAYWAAKRIGKPTHMERILCHQKLPFPPLIPTADVCLVSGTP